MFPPFSVTFNEHWIDRRTERRASFHMISRKKVAADCGECNDDDEPTSHERCLDDNCLICCCRSHRQAIRWRCFFPHCLMAFSGGYARRRRRRRWIRIVGNATCTNSNGHSVRDDVRVRVRVCSVLWHCSVAFWFRTRRQQRMCAAPGRMEGGGYGWIAGWTRTHGGITYF